MLSQTGWDDNWAVGKGQDSITDQKKKKFQSLTWESKSAGKSQYPETLHTNKKQTVELWCLALTGNVLEMLAFRSIYRPTKSKTLSGYKQAMF